MANVRLFRNYCFGSCKPGRNLTCTFVMRPATISTGIGSSTGRQHAPRVSPDAITYRPAGNETENSPVADADTRRGSMPACCGSSSNGIW